MKPAVLRVCFGMKPQVVSELVHCEKVIFQCCLTADGFGNWSNSGCRLVSDQTDDFVVCECDHLTHFGYLLVS